MSRTLEAGCLQNGARGKENIAPGGRCGFFYCVIWKTSNSSPATSVKNADLITYKAGLFGQLAVCPVGNIHYAYWNKCFPWKVWFWSGSSSGWIGLKPYFWCRKVLHGVLQLIPVESSLYSSCPSTVCWSVWFFFCFYK